MKREFHFLPPRQMVLYGYTRRMLDETAQNANSFAMAVAEKYLALVAPDVRSVPFKLGEGDGLAKAIAHNGQVFRRYMDGTVKVLPADLEDAWVLALPEPYRSECERDLARRRGVLPVKLSTNVEASEATSLAKLITDFGHLVEAVAPALSDGKITEADLPHARQILNESDDLITAVIGLRHQVMKILPGTGRND